MKIKRCKHPTKTWDWIHFIFTERVRFTVYFSWIWCLEFHIGISLHGIFLDITPISLHFDWYYKTTKELLGELRCVCEELKGLQKEGE